MKQIKRKKEVPLIEENEAIHKKIIYVLILILSTALLSACSASTSDSTGKYVVLIGEDSEITEKLSDIDLLVIDAEYFSQNDIARLRENGVREIYSYINIGSIESFRSYDTDFEKYTLGAYENWPEEKWIDVSAPEWQACTASRVDSLVQKGVDGFLSITRMYTITIRRNPSMTESLRFVSKHCLLLCLDIIVLSTRGLKIPFLDSEIEYNVEYDKSCDSKRNDEPCLCCSRK